MKDILVLGKVKSLDAAARRRPDHRGRARRRPRDHVPHLARRACSTRCSVGPVRKQATDVVELLRDPARCQVLLVTIPEETPVSELGRHRVRDRGPSRASASAGRGERLLRAELAATSTTAPPPPPACARGRRAARRVRVRPRGARPRARAARSAPSGRRSSTHQADRLARAAAAPADPAAVPLHRRPRACREIEHARRRVRRRGRARCEPVADTLAEVVEHGHVVVCCGSGGVGKTTTAAVLAIEGARRGRRRWSSPSTRRSGSPTRSGSTSSPTSRARSTTDAVGSRRANAIAGGALSAMMLDTKRTFDGLVTRYAASAGAGRSASSRTPSTATSPALSGTQEYMAMEKLHELHEEGGFDLIVVDTPPSRHALDFLDAPPRLLRLLDNRDLPGARWCRPAPVPARSRAPRCRRSSAPISRRRRLRGRQRHRRVLPRVRRAWRKGSASGRRGSSSCSASRTTRFVLITSPRRDAVEEARFFAEKIGDHNLAVDALDREPGAPTLRHRARGRPAGAGRVAAASSTCHGRTNAAARDRLARAVREPRRLQRDRRAGARHLETVPRAGRVGGGGVRAVPRPRRVRLRCARRGRPDPVRAGRRSEAGLAQRARE